MDDHNRLNNDSKITTSESSRYMRRGRKRKHASIGQTETENVQPTAKRLSTIHSPGEDASTSTKTRPTPVVECGGTLSFATGGGRSMPSIGSSGGSSQGPASVAASIHSDHTSDTQSSSDCFSNVADYDLFGLASVSSAVLSPACDDNGAPASNQPRSNDANATHQPHHSHRHQSDWPTEYGDSIPRGNKKTDLPPEVQFVGKPTSASADQQSEVDSCYWTPLCKKRACPMPAMSWADTEEMWNRMCRKDVVGWLAREPTMFNDHPSLQPRMRAILLDWLNEVCEVYKMYRETYYLAVDYIDRYLSSKKGLMKTHLQLLGITALFIAAKVEEIYPPKLRDFAYVTDGACSEEDILHEEVLLLCELEWNINPLTVVGWLGMYMQIKVTSREPDKQMRLLRNGAPKQHLHPIQSPTPAENKLSETGSTAQTDDSFMYPQFSAMEYAHTAQLIDLCSLDVGMASFQYSVIAAAAISHTFDRQTATLVSGLCWEEIAPCAKWMEPYFQVICEENASFPLTFPELNDQIKTGHGVNLIKANLLTDFYYNKQTHTTSLEMLDMVAIRIEEMESTSRMVQLEASPAPQIESSNGMLTPPASNRKSLEAILSVADGVCANPQHAQQQQHPSQEPHHPTATAFRCNR